MNKLNQNILKKIYILETRKTLVDVFLKIFVIAAGGFFALIFALALFDIFYEQQTFATLQLFHEDFDTIAKNINDVFYIIYEETPKETLLIFFGLIVITVVSLIAFIRNFSKIKNKLKTIVSYWMKY